MKILKTRLFSKWANKNDVRDESLFFAAQEIVAENYEAHYGGGVIKNVLRPKVEEKVVALEP